LEPPPTAILYKEDFESSLPSQFTNWSINVDDQGNHILCNDDSINGINSYIGENFWTNYAVEMRVEAIEQQEDPYMSIYARFNPAEYVGYYGALNFKTSIADLAYNNPYRNIGHQSYPAKSNTWYTLRLEVAGSEIQFFIDNQIIAEGTDMQRSRGQAGFAASPHLRVCVDDIRLWALTETGQFDQVSTPTATNVPAPTATATDVLTLTPTSTDIPTPTLAFYDKTLLRSADIHPEVWSHNSPRGASYEYKVNCGANYEILETCFLWDLDQVIVITPGGRTFELNKDFNINTYSGEITRR
jgi:hypothetical protein